MTLLKTTAGDFLEMTVHLDHMVHLLGLLSFPFGMFNNLPDVPLDGDKGNQNCCDSGFGVREFHGAAHLNAPLFSVNVS